MEALSIIRRPDMEIKKSKLSYAFLNIISSAIFQAVTFIAGIFVTRYILLFYGSEINGISSTINQIINYTAVLEAGLGLVSIQALYTPLALQDYTKINGICSAAKKYFSRIGLYYCIIISIVSIVYPLVAKGETNKITIFLLVLIISLTNFFEYFFHAKYRVLLTADQKLYIITFTKAVGMLISTIIKLVLILLHVNIIFVFGISSIILVLRILYVRWYVYKNYSHLDYFSTPDTAAHNQRSAVLIHQISGLVINNSGGILLSATVKDGLKVASVYAVYNLVYMSLYNLISSAFSGGIVASFGQLFGVEKKTSVVQKYYKYEIMYFMIISVVFGITAVMILPFIKLYTKNVTDIQYSSITLAVLFTCTQLLNSTRVPFSMIIDAIGHYKKTQYRALLETIINFTITLVLISKYNIIAILIGALCSYSYRTLDMIIYANKHILSTSPLRSFLHVLKCWLSVGLTVLFMKTFFILDVNSWMSWIVWSIISGISAIIIALSIFVPFEYKMVKDVIFNSLLRRKVKFM